MYESKINSYQKLQNELIPKLTRGFKINLYENRAKRVQLLLDFITSSMSSALNLFK